MPQLLVEGGTAAAVFVRCFADRKGMAEELRHKLHVRLPRGVLAAIAVIPHALRIFVT